MSDERSLEKAPAPQSRFYTWVGVGRPFDPTHEFVTSPVLSPAVLAAIRSLFAVYTLAVLIVRLTIDSVHSEGSTYFSYFTHLSWIGLAAYYCAAAVQSICYVSRGRTSYPLQNWPRPLQFLHTLLYSTIATYPIIVTVIFWTLLSDGDPFDTPYSTFGNLAQHALNLPVAMFEVFFSNAGYIPWAHMLFLDIMLLLYMAVGYITHATAGFYPYAFLKPKPTLAAYIVGIGLGECLLVIVVRGITWVRIRLVRKLGGRPAEPAVGNNAV